MQYFNNTNNTVISTHELRDLFPNMSIPEGADMSEYGYEKFNLTTPPEPLPFHRVVEQTPTENLQVWVQKPFSESEIIQIYIAAMERLFDQTAQARRYDSRITCALRAGYAGPFQSEGQAFALWMDMCNSTGYSILQEVKDGIRQQPSVEEFLGLLPIIVWPE